MLLTWPSYSEESDWSNWDDIEKSDSDDSGSGAEPNDESSIARESNAELVPTNFDKSATLLSQLKVLLTPFRSLPPLSEVTPNAVHELTVARDIYEHAVILSVKTEDQDASERDFFQLKPYYTDAGDRLPQSQKEFPILGLNLLRLLVQNRIAEFHTELELLSASALENPCIKHAVELEQFFMKGAYNLVLTARKTLPHETYVYFMDLLAKTVGEEIAGCGEKKAYDSLSINDARQILLFSSDQELSRYINETAVAVGVEPDNELPYNEYFEYFGPDYTLHVRPTPVENHNSPTDLEKVRNLLLEQISRLTQTPSVQFQTAPPVTKVPEQAEQRMDFSPKPHIWTGED